MRKIFALLLVLLVLAAAFLAGAKPAFGDELVEDSWVPVAPLRVTPSPYSFAFGAVALDGQIYFIGEGICERYDPEANNWTTVTPPPANNGGGAVAACQNKIYVIGDPTLVYDPATDTWESRSALPITIIGYQANVVDGKIYVISGGKPAFYSITDPSGANYVYDPETDAWSEMAPIPTPVDGYASAVIDNKIYIIGGGTATGMLENATNIVQIFDPETNKWTNGTSMPTGVYKAGACSTSGLFAPKRIYVVGGNLYYNTGGILEPYAFWSGSNLNQVYDPNTGDWSTETFLPDSRWRPSLVNVIDTLYVVGGVSGIFADGGIIHVQACWKYIPTGYSETPIPNPTAEPFPTAPVLAASIIAIVVGAGLLVYHKKRKRKV